MLQSTYPCWRRLARAILGQWVWYLWGQFRRRASLRASLRGSSIHHYNFLCINIVEIDNGSSTLNHTKICTYLNLIRKSQSGVSNYFFHHNSPVHFGIRSYDWKLNNLSPKTTYLLAIYNLALKNKLKKKGKGGGGTWARYLVHIQPIQFFVFLGDCGSCLKYNIIKKLRKIIIG